MELPVQVFSRAKRALLQFFSTNFPAYLYDIFVY